MELVTRISPSKNFRNMDENEEPLMPEPPYHQEEEKVEISRFPKRALFVVLIVISLFIIIFLAYLLYTNIFQSKDSDGLLGNFNSVKPSDSDSSTCIQEWNCTSWGNCTDNLKYRSCADTNKCNNISDSPKTSANC